jgi:hypothetical protein
MGWLCNRVGIFIFGVLWRLWCWVKLGLQVSKMAALECEGLVFLAFLFRCLLREGLNFGLVSRPDVRHNFKSADQQCGFL